jgi:hypothetical protein
VLQTDSFHSTYMLPPGGSIGLNSITTEYVQAGNEVTPTPPPFPIVCAALYLSIQYPALLNKDILGQVPKFYCRQCLTVTKNMWDHFKWLSTSSSFDIINDKLPSHYSQLISGQVEEFPSPFSRGSVKKARNLPLSMKGLPVLDLLLVQSLITPVTTFEDMPRADSGPVSRCEEPCRG